jgi:hypothetical protein
VTLGAIAKVGDPLFVVVFFHLGLVMASVTGVTAVVIAQVTGGADSVSAFVIDREGVIGQCCPRPGVSRVAIAALTGEVVRRSDMATLTIGKASVFEFVLFPGAVAQRTVHSVGKSLFRVFLCSLGLIVAVVTCKGGIVVAWMAG